MHVDGLPPPNNNTPYYYYNNVSHMMSKFNNGRVQSLTFRYRKQVKISAGLLVPLHWYYRFYNGFQPKNETYYYNINSESQLILRLEAKFPVLLPSEIISIILRYLTFIPKVGDDLTKEMKIGDLEDFHQQGLGISNTFTNFF